MPAVEQEAGFGFDDEEAADASSRANGATYRQNFGTVCAGSAHIPAAGEPPRPGEFVDAAFRHFQRFVDAGELTDRRRLAE